MPFKGQLAEWLRRLPPLRWLLALGVRVFVPRHYVGAVGAIFNDAGQVLLIKHVFRPHFPWGLPGGWIERNESPPEAIRREFEEELGLTVEIKQVLLCELQGGSFKNTTPRGLGLVYYCRLAGHFPFDELAARAQQNYEILSIEWADPTEITYKLSPLERSGIILAKQVFDRERMNQN
jgi:8-oxo-dGTP pyrophosphatase MutT (NUDIX family)